jgi:hypothetical protein
LGERTEFNGRTRAEGGANSNGFFQPSGLVTQKKQASPYVLLGFVDRQIHNKISFGAASRKH